MKITIAAAGRFRPGPEKSLYEKYIQRLPWSTTLVEVDERRARNAKHRRSQEAVKFIQAIPKGATVIALDARGKTLSSEGIAERLRNWQDEGVRSLIFVIGGADGLDQDLLRRADLILSLGSMTWPHLLVRVMLAEQLYRAGTLISGHPYHRG